MEILFLSVFGIVAALVLLQLVAYLSLRYKVKSITLCAEDDLPPDVIELFETPQEMLESFGFEKEHLQKLVMQVNTRDIELWQYIFFHPHHYSYASISTTTLPKNRAGYEIAFQAIYGARDLLLTTNNYMHYLPAKYSDAYVEDIYSDNWEQVLSHHLKRIEHRAESPLHVEAQWYAQTDLEDSHHQIEVSIACGDMHKHDDGTYGFTLKGALKTVFRVFVGERRTRRPKVQARSSSTTQSVERDITMYHQFKEASKSPLSKWKKFALFSGSLLIFALAFGFVLSWDVMVMIVGVLLLHEGGHLLAMYLLGYKELQILFLPFIGAVATSKQPQYSTYKSFIVLLMGPLPGIILGMALLFYTSAQSPEWIGELAGLLLVINLFNLLPIMPLDGGQILHQLLFFRRPMLQVFFMITSAVLALLLAVYLGPSMWLIALLVLWVAYATSVQALFRRAFFASGVDMEDESAYLQQIFRFFKQPKYQNYTFSKKYHIAEHLLAHRLTRPLHVMTVVLLLGIYVTTLFAPPVLVAKQMFNRQFEPTATVSWETRLAEATDNDARWELLMRAGEAHEGEANATHYYEEAVALARQEWPKSERMNEALLAYAQSVQYDLNQSAEPIYLELLALQNERNSSNSMALSEIYTALAHSDINQSKEAKYLSWQEHSIALLQEYDPNDYWNISQAYSQLAMLKRDRDDMAGCETALKKALALHTDHFETNPFFPVRELIYFYLQQQRPDTALELLLAQIPLQYTQKDLHIKYQWETLAGWVYVMNEMPQEATTHFGAALAALEQMEALRDDSISFFKWFVDIPTDHTAMIEALGNMMLVSDDATYANRFQSLVKEQYQTLDTYLKLQEKELAYSEYFEHTMMLKRLQSVKAYGFN